MGGKSILITMQTFTENTITVCADNDDKIQRLFFFVCSLNLKQTSWERKEGKKKKETPKGTTYQGNKTLMK